MNVGVLAILLALLLLPRTVGAQTPEARPDAAAAGQVAPTVAEQPVDPKAKALFDEAVRLTGEGKFPEACAKLEESLKLHEGTGTAFNLARCWQKIGRTASAYALFETVVRKTRQAGQLERTDAAQAKLDALLPKLSRLRIDLQSRPARTEVWRNGQIVPESDWGKPVPVDPGSYEVKVAAEGKKPWSQKLQVTEPGMTIAVAVPELGVLPPVVPVVAAAKPPAKPQPPPEKAKKRSPVFGIGLAAIGVAGLGVGIFKAAEYSSSNGKAKDTCPSGVNCTADDITKHEEYVNDAKEARNWAYVGFGVGAAALGGAAYLLFLAPSGGEKSKKGRLRMSPYVAQSDGWGATLEGSF